MVPQAARSFSITSGLSGSPAESASRTRTLWRRELEIEVPVDDPKGLIQDFASLSPAKETACLVATLDRIDRELPALSIGEVRRALAGTMREITRSSLVITAMVFVIFFGASVFSGAMVRYRAYSTKGLSATQLAAALADNFIPQWLGLARLDRRDHRQDRRAGA